MKRSAVIFKKHEFFCGVSKLPSLRLTERVLLILFFSPVGFTMSHSIDCGCQVVSGFDCHLGLTEALGLDLMLVSIRC